ncbi:2665_t:CDS:2, partial [Scutellospora calospora]
KMPIASIRISKGSKVVHGWYIHPILYEISIRDLFVKLTTRELSQEYNIDTIDPETIERVEISKTQDATATQSTQSYANTQAKQFVACLTEAIWYIDMHDHQKFEEHSYHIPELFFEFFGHVNSESYKHSRKPFDANELNLYCQALAPYATSS